MASDKLDISVTKLVAGDSIRINHTNGNKFVLINIVDEVATREVQTAFDTTNIAPKVDQAAAATLRTSVAFSDSEFVTSTKVNGTIVSITFIDNKDFNVAPNSIVIDDANGSLIQPVRQVNDNGDIFDKITDPAIFNDALVANIQVTSVTHQLIEYGYPAKNFPTGNLGNVLETVIEFTAADIFTSLSFNWGWIKNSEPIYRIPNSFQIQADIFTSIYDGTPQGFVGNVGVLQAVAPLSWVTGEAELISLGGNDYRLIHTHTIPKLPQPDDLNVFEYIVPEELKGAESIKYPFEINLTEDITDPNPSETTRIYDLANFIQNGSIGTFGQVYKTGLNYYNLVDFNWLTPSAKLNNGIQSEAECTISSSIALSPTSELTLTIMEVTDSFNNNENLLTNTSYDRVKVNIDGVVASGSILKSVDAALTNPNEVILTFEVEQASMQNTYVVWAEINDDNITANNHNVILTIDEVQTAADDSVVVFDTRDGTVYDEFIFNYHWNDDITEGFNQIKSFVEDVTIARWQIKNIDTVNTVLDRFEIRIASRTNNTQEEFLSVKASDLPFTQERIFELADTSIRKEISIYESDVGEWQFDYPFQVWKDWVGVDNLVIQVNGVFRQTVATGDVLGFTNRWLSPDFQLGNYDETRNTAAEPQALRTTSSMQFFKLPSNTPVSKIQKTGQTLVVATFEDNNLNDLQSGEVAFPAEKTTANTDVGNLCGYLGITSDRLTQREYLRFHNIRENPLDTLWSEPTGHEVNYAKLTVIDQKTAKIEGVIDADKIVERFGNFDSLYISCRLDKFQTNTGTPVMPEFVFQTTFDVPTDGTFEPSTSWLAAFARTWEFVDGTQVTSDSLSINDRLGLDTNELNGVQQDVKIIIPSGESFSDMDILNLSQSEGIGQLDLTVLSNIQQIIAPNNNFSDVVFPASVNVNNIILEDNNLSGTLDTTPLGANFGGNFNVNNNSITALNITNGAGSFQSFVYNNNDILGTSNLSGLLLEGIIQGASNVNLDVLVLPIPVGVVNNISYDNCGIIDIDLTPLDNFLEGSIRFVNQALNGGGNTFTLPANVGLLTRLFLFGNNFTGAFNSLNGLGNSLAGDVQIGSNPYTSIDLPVSSSIITTLNISVCPNLTSLDLETKLTGCQGKLFLFSNPAMTTLDLPLAYSGNITELRIESNNLLPSIGNVSELGGNWSGQWKTSQNDLIPSWVIPANNGLVTLIDVSGSAVLASLDITALTGVNDSIIISANDCILSTAQLDALLVFLDGTGWINGTLNIQNNAGLPTGGASNANKLSLEAKGWTINI